MGGCLWPFAALTPPAVYSNPSREGDIVPGTEKHYSNLWKSSATLSVLDFAPIPLKVSGQARVFPGQSTLRHFLQMMVLSR